MIEIDHLTYHYEIQAQDDERMTLKDVCLTIADGEFLCVLGHNGSGKSTLAKHLNAILLPMGGHVWVDGMDTADPEKIWDIRQHVGMVFQNPDNQIVATIVEEDVAFAAENLGVAPKEIRRRVDYALSAVGMEGYKKHAPHLLSGGQKQRVAIAGVIAMMPKVIVFDEPTAMLDPIGRREVLKTIRRLNRDYHITIVLITHNMDEAALSDRIVVMDDGKIVMDGTPKSVFSKVERLKQLGLDTPQVTELAYRLKKAGIAIKDDITSVDECVEELMRLCQS